MQEYLKEIQSLPIERLEWLLHFWIGFPKTFDHEECFTVILLKEKQKRMELE